MSNYITGSPSVSIKEQDLATFVNPTSVTVGAMVGNFEWGPCNTPVICTNEDDLLRIFKKPTDENYKDWFSARNYLTYSNDIRIVREVGESSKNASDVTEEAALIESQSDFTSKYSTLSSGTAKVFAKYPGTYGNNIRVVIENAAKIAKGESILGSHVNQILDDNSIVMGVFVKDEMVEFGIYSLLNSATDFDGNTNYIFNAVNKRSQYVYLIEKTILAYIESQKQETSQNAITIDSVLSGGVLNKPNAGNYITGWNLFKDSDLYDISLLIQGGSDATVAKHILDNIASARKDCIACVSPQESEIVNLPEESRVTTIVEASTTMGFSSYRFMDGNYKYQYDPYNNVYRWIPLNGDIAGIFAEVDANQAPWYSPGNHAIHDCIKLAFNPTKAERDELYKNRINPVVAFRNSGFVLYGDWTGAPQTTSFNFVNVRRLFIYIEKAVSEFAREVMWKQNDAITQASFYQSVDPFLRGIQGGRGIEDFKIICDSTVNSPSVVSAGQFIAKIYIKPIYSVRWVEITFVSTRSDVDFEEIAQSN